jgi:hypothetical protein
MSTYPMSLLTLPPNSWKSWQIARTSTRVLHKWRAYLPLANNTRGKQIFMAVNICFSILVPNASINLVP